MTIVVVTGSRSLVDSDARVLIKQTFVDLITGLRPVIVHHGGSTGPDAWASGAFEAIQKVHRPENTDNRQDAIAALFQRNKTMILEAVYEAADNAEQAIMVACWDGVSRGTLDAFEYAQSLDVPVVFTPVRLCKAYVACQQGWR